MGTQTQQGSSLIEVMVALFVLAIGLLGMLAMQSKSMQYNQAAYAYSQAAYLASDMAERIRSNQIQAADYDVGAVDKDGAQGACDQVACAPADLVAWDTVEWAQNINQYLPGGQGSIDQVAGGDFLQITVSFIDDRTGADPTQVGELQTYSLVVEI